MYGEDRNIPEPLAAAIIAALGDGWSHRPHPENPGLAYLHGPNGAVLWLTKSWDHKGKVSVSAHYPPNDAYNVKNLSINVGETRGAEVIAKEINRRLLPEYLPELERVVADNERRTADRGRRQMLARELAQIAGGRVNPEDKRNAGETTVSLPYRDDAAWGEFHIDAKANSGCVDLRRLTVDQLRAIAAVFGK